MISARDRRGAGAPSPRLPRPLPTGCPPRERNRRSADRLTGDPTAYTYLPASVAAFLGPDELAEVMRDAGLVPLPPIPLMLGSLVIHVGFKPTVPGRA